MMSKGKRGFLADVSSSNRQIVPHLFNLVMSFLLQSDFAIVSETDAYLCY